MAHGINLRLTNLTLNAEVALDILRSTDCPLKGLILRKIDIERIAHIEPAGELYICLSTLREGYILNLDLANVDNLLKLKIYGASRGVNRGGRLLTLGTKCEDVELDDGIGNIVVDTTCCRKRSKRNEQISK